jgi:hypothetical protein
MKRKGINEPEWVPNEDMDINLEHVIPDNPDKNWPNLDRDTVASLYTRLGNMVLLQASKNSVIGNSPFSDKRKAFRESAYVLTAEVAEYRDWTAKEVAQRQAKLADTAVQTWPLRAKK